MNRPVLFAMVASLAAGAACDKKAAPPAPSGASAGAPNAGTSAAASPDAATAPPASAPQGPFTLSLAPQGELVAGASGSVALELKDAAGGRVTALDVIHDKQLHLIVVSPDLSFFSHVHPAARPDGTFTAEITLPHPADYVAFADFKPTGAPQTVVRSGLVVAGDPPAAVPLVAASLPARGSFDGFEVSVRSKAPLVAGGDAVLEFEILEKGAAVSDLQDYLGARGHCVIISADTNAYLHSHPLGGAGSKVQFHTTLPAAGTYKVWAEFRPGGKPLLASFVLDVPTASAAPKVKPHGHDHGPGGHAH